MWAVTHPKKMNWIGTGVVGSISILVTLPWTITMVKRYGVSVFSNAFMSHGRISFSSLFQNPTSYISLLGRVFQSLYVNPVFLILVIAGVVFLIVKKQYTLPILFLFVSCVLFLVERYILTISFIVVGCMISSIYKLFTSRKVISNRPLEKLVSTIAFTCLFIPVYFQSFNLLSQQHPIIDQGMVDAGSYMKNKTPSGATYLPLFIGDSDAEEWLPYLSQREPVLSVWGSEWSGTFDIQGGETNNLRECIKMESISCLDAWLVSTQYHPEYIVMQTGIDQLTSSFEHNPEWMKVYSNSKYNIWKLKQGT